MPSFGRNVFFAGVVLAFSYFTAFMETLTISGYNKYCFEVPRDVIYTKGSAFYGIYFIVSYPVFYLIDEKTKLVPGGPYPHTMYKVIMEAMGASMIVLLLLDFCRLGMGKDLNIIGANGYYLFKDPTK